MSFRRSPLARPLVLGGVAATSAILVLGVAGPASAETEVAEPATFTSAFTVMATPDQVVNPDGVVTPGTADATGTFDFRINSDSNIICYDITLTGVSGDYMSPAKTATHIHQAAAGKAGPPRIAFPNPSPIGDGPRTSSGCLQGPFTTGVLANGVDTGEGFTLAQLEADAASFAADSHSVANPAGIVRGQLSRVPVGGVQTGGGGLASDRSESGASFGVLGLGAAALLGTAGVLALRRRAAGRS
ncbi:MAG: hypothetical protein RI885_2366 [Actinomycetota bacterium]|jgi:hypothetical protein